MSLHLHWEAFAPDPFVTVQAVKLHVPHLLARAEELLQVCCALHTSTLSSSVPQVHVVEVNCAVASVFAHTVGRLHLGLSTSVSVLAVSQ
jgi:hypothetical protein